MAEEQIMNERCNTTPYTQFNEPHGRNVPLPAINSVSAIRRKNSSSKRRRQRSRRKRVESDRETNNTNLDGSLKKVSSPAVKCEQRFVPLKEQNLSSYSTAGSSIDIHFQIKNFENEWEQQPDSEAQFY